MADWPLQQISRMDGMRGANPFLGVTATGGAANTKGSWVRVANAPFDCCGIVINFAQHSSTSDYLIDVGVGASGAETVVIPDILCGSSASSSRGRSFFFPLYLPSGARVSVRCQNATLSSTIVADVFFMGESFKGSPSFERFHTYGVLPATSTAVGMANPAGNAWSIYTTLVAATAWDHGWIMPVLSDGGITSRTTGQRFAMQIAAGAAGSEVPCSPPLWLTCPSACLSLHYQPGWHYAIPRGTRLSGRQAASAALTLGMTVAVYAGIMGG